MAAARVLVLGGSFGGLTAARLIHRHCGDAAAVTVIDLSPQLVFTPNIALEVLSGRDPAASLCLPTAPLLRLDGGDFIHAEVEEIDLRRRRVGYVPAGRPGSAVEHVGYDYLVIALGTRLAYDGIEGFAEHGHAVSDCYYGNKLRRHLAGGAYRGGPVAIGSARSHRGRRGRPSWLPDTRSASDLPAVETALALGGWLRSRGHDPSRITLFTPGRAMCEELGHRVSGRLGSTLRDLGARTLCDTRDIVRLTSDGVELASGESIDAELKIVLPGWQPHDVLRSLPITDEAGFVVTDVSMRCVDRADVFAVGDCAALSVPKLAVHALQQARVVAHQLAAELGKVSASEACSSFEPRIVCAGTMGGDRGFYVDSSEWYGGEPGLLETGHAYLTLKLAQREIYFRTGGMPPHWGLPRRELPATAASERSLRVEDRVGSLEQLVDLPL